MPALPDITGKNGNNYRVERLAAHNLQDLDILYRSVYGINKPINYFQKKYNTEFTGVSNIGYIAYDKSGRPAAYYGVIPCFICWENQKILAAQSADTMTDPGHRHQGLFVELSKLVLELCPESGIRFVFGFPNKNAYPAMVSQLNWKSNGNMDCFRIKVPGLSFGQFTSKTLIVKNVYEKYLRLVLGKRIRNVKGIRNSVTDAGFAGICRDEAYLEYKTLAPSTVISIADVDLWLNSRYGLMIGDVNGLSEDNFNTVVSELKKIAARAGLSEIQFHCSKGTPLHTIFASNYEAIISYPELYQDFGCPVSPSLIKFTFADIDIF